MVRFIISFRLGQGLPFLVDGFDLGLGYLGSVDGRIPQFGQVGLEAEGVERDGGGGLADLVDVQVVLAAGTVTSEVVESEGLVAGSLGEVVV